MIKFIFLGFIVVAFIFLVYEVGYVHGYEDAGCMNHEKGERDDEKTN